MLKCKMIHSYPREYYQLYEAFRDGGTKKHSACIREWVNTVERMGKAILDTNGDITLFQLKQELPEDWEAVAVDGEFRVSGPKNPKVVKMMRIMTADWVRDQEYWVVSPEQLAEYVQKDIFYKFKGDMLEVFAEIFFTIFHADEGIGIREYTPGDLADDFGVDATGINVNGHKVAVQVKYRSDPAELISYADISRTFTSAVCQLQMLDVVKYDHTVYLFTISSGVTAAFQRVMGRKTVVITRPMIAAKVDNNMNFWKMAFDMIVEAMKNSE